MLCVKPKRSENARRGVAATWVYPKVLSFFLEGKGKFGMRNLKKLLKNLEENEI